MPLPSVSDLEPGKTVWLRLDLDVPLENGRVVDSSRLRKSFPTIKYLLAKNCRLLIVGHNGRPTNADPALSLRPVYLELLSLFGNTQDYSAVFLEEMGNADLIALALLDHQIVFGENLRFFPGEETRDPDLVRTWAGLVDVVVNDALAAYHPAASTTAISRLLPTYFGFSYQEEYEALTKLKETSPRPLGLILGGIKKDKLDYLAKLVAWTDLLFIGGRLPLDLPEFSHPQVLVAKLTSTELDITQTSLEAWLAKMSTLQTVVWAGPLGRVETEEGRVTSLALVHYFRTNPKKLIVAGGDTQAFVANLPDPPTFQPVSGGGAMLFYLAHHYLPMTEAYIKGTGSNT